MSHIFINHVNTYLGQALLEEFRNDDTEEDNPNLIFATLDPTDSTARPNGIKKVLNRSKPQAFKKYILGCDLIIYDLHTADLEEVEAVVKLLTVEKYEEGKTIVCISSVLVWADTPPKLVEKTAEDPESEGEEAPVEEPPELGEDGEPIPRPKPKRYKQVPFDERDYTLRKAPVQYEGWKSLETLLLAAGMKRDNLSVYVLCAGLMYGLGENLLSHHFRCAWLESPTAIPYIGSGLNQVPTIHLIDLCKAAKYVATAKPDVHYLFAIDNTEDRKQLSIIKSISEGMGTGEVQTVEYGAVVNEPWAAPLMVNLTMNFSKVLIPDRNEEDEEFKMPFEWHSLAGIPGNIRKLNEEYNLYRGLQPIKIFVTGPPASGKTHYAARLAELYNIPLIQVSDVATAIQALDSELGEAVRTRLEELKDEMIKEAESKKKKNQEIDYSKIKPRVPDDLLAEAFRWRLGKNHCRNRGFILDGWPRNYADAQRMFMTKAQPAEGEEAVDEGEEKLVVDMSLLPQHVIVLKVPTDIKGAQDQLIQRVKSLPEDILAGTHWNDEGMKRRLQKYKEENLNEKGAPAVQDFFIRNSVDVFTVDCLKAEVEAFESLKIYVERAGRPYNFFVSPEELEKEHVADMERKEADLNAQKNFEAERQDAIEQEARTHREQQALMQFEQIKMKEREILETKSQPLRHYLMDNVIPILADGLLEVCKMQPDDPVDYLAEYLFKHSSEVRQTDPSAY